MKFGQSALQRRTSPTYYSPAAHGLLHQKWPWIHEAQVAVGSDGNNPGLFRWLLSLLICAVIIRTNYSALFKLRKDCIVSIFI